MNTLYDMLPDGSKRNEPEIIVVHAMGEYIKDGKQYTARDFLEKLGWSAHVMIHPNGDRTVCRDDSQGAFHAGRDKNGVDRNKNSLGIEILVPGVHDYGTFLEAIKRDYCSTEAFKSAASQVREWMNMHDISADEVYRHSDLSPGRKLDPGSGFDWSAFMKAIN